MGQTSRGTQVVGRVTRQHSPEAEARHSQSGTAVRPGNGFGPGPGQGDFTVSSQTLNVIKSETGITHAFPGNISPEGYFYAPFHEVVLKELDDELQTSDTRRINFIPSESNVIHQTGITFYNPEVGCNTVGDIYELIIATPVPYSNLIVGQPFCIYDVLNDETHRGYLNTQEGRTLSVYTSSEIDQNGFVGNDNDGKSRYIVAYLTENVPTCAEYIPTAERLVWRGAKKMSELSSDSPLYNMPFTNGRLYIHKNVDVFLRRQDPHGEYYLYRPSQRNPLKRFQIEGDAKIDLDYIKYITDSMIDAC